MSAVKLFEAGYHQLVRIRKNDKRPSNRGWRTFEPSPEDVEQWDKNEASVGVQTSHFPAIDLDIADAELAKLVRTLVLETLGPAAVRGRKDSSKELLVYRTDEPFTKRVAKLVKEDRTYTVEVLGKGQQFVAYGIHPDGHPYRWKTKTLYRIPPAKLTTINGPSIDDLFQKLAEAAGVWGWALMAGSSPKAEGTQTETISEGSRNDTMASIAGLLRQKNLSKPATLAALMAENDARCDPPLSVAEIKAVLASVWRYEPGEAVTTVPAEDEFETDPEVPAPAEGTAPHTKALHELNTKYAVVQIGSDVVIMQENTKTGNPPLLSFAAFRNLYENRRIMWPSPSGAPKAVPLAKAWIEWPNRRQYARLVFRPGVKDRKDEYNLWRGWAKAPSSRGSCQLFLDHLREVVCQEEDQHSEWLLDWMAHLFQYPSEKPGTAVAIRGRQGAGKSIVGATLARLLGPCAYVVADSHAVTGHFNAHLANNLLLLCEEAFWAGSKAGTSSLKHLVTGTHLSIERKGVDAVMMTNHTRLLITSNASWVWPADMDDRRLAIFHASDVKVRDTEYFSAMIRQLKKGGGDGKLLKFLLDRKIDADRLRYAPRTAALAEQALHTMDHHEAWLYQLLEAGEIEGSKLDGGGVKTHSITLYNSYRATVPPRERVLSETAFGMFALKALPIRRGGREHVGHWANSARSRTLLMGPLAECRKKYSNQGRAALQEWGEPDEWITLNETGEIEDYD